MLMRTWNAGKNVEITEILLKVHRALTNSHPTRLQTNRQKGHKL